MRVAGEFDDLDTGVQQIVQRDLIASIHGFLQVPPEHWMSLQQEVEGLRQRVDVDGAIQVGTETDEILSLGEHLLAARELSYSR